MDVIEAIHTRRSIRAFSPTPVERGLVESVILDAAQAPPPFRGQVPWTFNVVEGVERIAALGGRARRYAIDHRQGASESDWLDREDFKIFWDAPALIVISGTVADGCRAGQNLMLSAHGRGLGTCWVGSPLPWLKTAEAKRELGVPEAVTPVAALCLGYPAVVPDAPPRQRPPIIWAR